MCLYLQTSKIWMITLTRHVVNWNIRWTSCVILNRKKNFVVSVLIHSARKRWQQCRTWYESLLAWFAWSVLWWPLVYCQHYLISRLEVTYIPTPVLILVTGGLYCGAFSSGIVDSLSCTFFTVIMLVISISPSWIVKTVSCPSVHPVSTFSKP